MDWPRFQVEIRTMMLAVAAAAVFFFLASVSPPLIIAFSVPLVSCVVASHTFSRCRSDGRTPNREDWGTAASRAVLIAAPIKLITLIAILR